MDIEEKIKLVKEVGEEIIDDSELKDVLSKKNLIAYDGFEPSGRIHIAQGIMRSINVNKMTKAGVKFKMLVADWHALANDKFGGDMDKIRKCGKYFIEVWKACGMDLENVEFVWGTDLINDEDYWLKVMNIARANTIKRMTRCAQIMGRSESDALSAAQIFYPAMQCADIFHLDADICQLGLDQRKVNVLAREVAPKLGFKKPIVVSHHMLMGLTEPDHDATGTDAAIAKKMSKSNPDSAIFMTDSEEDVNRKIKKAYCPEKQVKDNPILEYCEYMIFERFDKVLVERPEKFGGNLEFNSYKELETSFESGSLHPLDLKNTVSKYIIEMIKPVNEYFEKNKDAKKLKEEVESFSVTR
ncbi:MAG: tyrosine--tRNA ligase [Candidatus Woesearchaeota archaeon]